SGPISGSSRPRHPGRERGWVEAAVAFEVRLVPAAVERREEAGRAVVAAAAEAAERELPARADGAAVPVEEARRHAPDAAQVARPVAREDGGDEPVVGVVRGADRVLEVVDRVERRLGAEDLLALRRVTLARVAVAHESGPDEGRREARVGVE